MAIVEEPAPDKILGYTDLNRHNIIKRIGQPEHPHAESKHPHSCIKSNSPSPVKSRSMSAHSPSKVIQPLTMKVANCVLD